MAAAAPERRRVRPGPIPDGEANLLPERSLVTAPVAKEVGGVTPQGPASPRAVVGVFVLAHGQSLRRTDRSRACSTKGLDGRRVRGSRYPLPRRTNLSLKLVRHRTESLPPPPRRPVMVQ